MIIFDPWKQSTFGISQFHKGVNRSQFQRFPDACKDQLGRLRVGAAIGVLDFERAASLIEKDVDVLVVDSAHGHSSNVIETVRGIKDKYEVHHGIRIADAALVAAAHMSHRYIADRFLPDKAIDLVDEAAAGVKMELESLPLDIDKIERRTTSLEIERQALRKEKDAASRQRLGDVERLIRTLYKPLCTVLVTP